MKLPSTNPWLLLLLSAACATDQPATEGTAPGGSDSTSVSRAVAGAAGSSSVQSSTTMTAASTPRARPSPGNAAAPSNPAAVASPGSANPAANGGGDSAAPLGECEGFKVQGAMYSPGGDVLPNKCMPYDSITNNPYAVRCMDAWPWYKTQYPGDEYCILPPPPDKGTQYGVHPQGADWYAQVSQGDMSGYENLGDEWLMNDGEEEQGNYHTAVVTTEEHNFYRSNARMRAGSHHMIVNGDPNAPGDNAWAEVTPGGLLDALSGFVSTAKLPGAQRPDEDRPQSLAKPPEDAGLYRKLAPGAKVTFNMHHFNAQGKTILKEAWTNLWWEEDARFEEKFLNGLDAAQVATMSIPPGATQDLHYSWTIDQPVRLLETFGHRHAWTTNFSAWIEQPDGTQDIVYQSFNWVDEPTYRYDSITQNPLPSPGNLADGALSGIRMLMPGQKLHYNCHIEYTSERAAAENAPEPSEIGTIGFANEAFTGEMCILFGATAAIELPAAVEDTSPLPDFATLD